MRFTLETLTRQDAAQILRDTKRRNRFRSPGTVAGYERAMRTGKWLVTHEALAFDTNGDLLDGQHRLQAFIDSDLPSLTTWVARGCDPDTFYVINTERSRSTGDAVSMSTDKKKTRQCWAVSAAIPAMQIRQRGGGRRQSMSRAELNEYCVSYVREHSAAIEFAVEASAAHSRSLTGWCGPSTLAWVLHHAFNYSQPKAVEFAAGFATGANLQSSDPRLLARNAMMRIKATTGHALFPMSQCFVIAKAWNYYAHGKTLKSMPITVATEAEDGKKVSRVPSIAPHVMGESYTDDE